MAKVISILKIRHFLESEGLRLSALQFRSQWGADRAESRLKIRKALLKRVKNKKVLSFKTVSKCDDFYFSISHTSDCGGYALARDPIGFDLESGKRPISPQVIKRVSNSSDRLTGLTPHEIWVAKEAAFKAISAHAQIKTISQVNIRPLKKNISYKTLKFSTKPSKIKGLRARGKIVVFDYKNTTMGIAWLTP